MKTTQEKLTALEEVIKNASKEISKLKQELKNPTFQKGWYHTGRKDIAYINKEDELWIYGYGFVNGRWENRLKNAIEYKERPATKEEVEEALIKERDKKGYKYGQRLKSLLGGTTDITKKGKEGFCELENRFWMGGSILMENGIWAEIISEPELKIAGYKISKIEHGGIEIGCKKMNIEQVLNIKKFMDKYKFSTVRFDHHGEVTLEEINKILEL